MQAARRLHGVAASLLQLQRHSCSNTALASIPSQLFAALKSHPPPHTLHPATTQSSTHMHTYRRRLNHESDCLPFGKGIIDTLSRGLKDCFQLAADLNLDIAITPHVDDGGKDALWRNALKLNPLEYHGQWSYTSMLLRPMAEALAAVAKPGMRIWFCLQVRASAQHRVGAWMAYPAGLQPALAAWLAASGGHMCLEHVAQAHGDAHQV
jgi:hypothetical protein